MEHYDVYDYYGEGDAQLALLLSVFSVLIGALTWLRKVQSSFYLIIFAVVVLLNF